jgi:putative peptidoglycan lipid II flippase
VVRFLIDKSKAFLNHSSSNILSAAAIIAVSYLGSAFLGLIRNHLLAGRFFGGQEAVLDAYFAAFVIPDSFFQLLVMGAISASFIPLYQEYLHKGEQEASDMTNRALSFFGLVFLFFSLVVVLAARPLASLLTGYEGSQLDLVVNLMRIMSLSQIIFTISSFYTGVLQARSRFLVPALAPILYNFGTILGILFLSPYLGIYGVAFGVVIGSLLHLLAQVPTGLSLGYVPKFIWDLKHAGLRAMIKLMPPRALALGLDQIERAIAVSLASGFAAGSLSIFNFARQLYILPISLFGVSLSQAAFPKLSEDILKKSNTDFREPLSKSILQVFFFALPASILILVLRVPLVRIAFGAKAFPWEATLTTGRALAFLALSIAPQAVTHILTRAFHATQDTKTPVYIGFVTMAIFMALAYYLGQHLGYTVVGITIALSITNTIDFIALYAILRRRIGPLGISSRIFKMVFTSLVTGIALWLPMRLLDQFVFDTTRTLPLIALTLTASFIGFVVYLIFCYIFRIEELAEVINLGKKLGNWRKILSKSDEVIDNRSTTQN